MKGNTGDPSTEDLARRVVDGILLNPSVWSGTVLIQAAQAAAHFAVADALTLLARAREED